jgi:hypothetical protein
MTAVKVITTQRAKSTRHFDATTEIHQHLFDGVIRAQHSKTWKQRIAGLKKMISAAKNLNGKH